jgi:hypothetical protein
MRKTSDHLHAALPGEELVLEGLGDLSAGRETAAALVIEVAAPRLRALGIDVSPCKDSLGRSPEHRLYVLLSAQPDAHSRYNALLGRIASYSRAAEHATTR